MKNDGRKMVRVVKSSLPFASKHQQNRSLARRSAVTWIERSDTSYESDPRAQVATPDSSSNVPFKAPWFQNVEILAWWYTTEQLIRSREPRNFSDE